VLPRDGPLFLGRLDQQVKFAAFALLGEIETILNARPEVKQAVVRPGRRVLTIPSGRLRDRKAGTLGTR
jgi:hypothetical protein